MAVHAQYAAHAFPHDPRAITTRPALEDAMMSASVFLGEPGGGGHPLAAPFAPAGNVVQSRLLCSGAASTSGRPASLAPASQGLLSHLYRHGVEMDALIRIETVSGETKKKELLFIGASVRGDCTLHEESDHATWMKAMDDEDMQRNQETRMGSGAAGHRLDRADVNTGGGTGNDAGKAITAEWLKQTPVKRRELEYMTLGAEMSTWQNPENKSKAAQCQLVASTVNRPSVLAPLVPYPAAVGDPTRPDRPEKTTA
ncbi:putative BOI-related E3 ubiquitin-protein ligase 2 [Panicum miliaceum]|uniref:BOI-related E3 ubiquitin-protein ligase 2 n=1 Tax=Panicum miliaceum TaxID=4540 RepID=A0A3L6RRH1_PANMI|nr:putative BOI-related E3 ubiquitin-protein ligase 2 [Panicum miliaceum]